MDYTYPILIDSPEMLAEAFAKGWIVDGRDGGLVRGRLHNQGNILMIQPTDVLGQYCFVGYMEGGEFLMCQEATEKHFDEIQAINEFKAECSDELILCANSRVIDTGAEPHDKLLVIHKQFIVNAHATRRHFSRLEEINGQYRHHIDQFFDDACIEIIKNLE